MQRYHRLALVLVVVAATSPFGSVGLGVLGEEDPTSASSSSSGTTSTGDQAVVSERQRRDDVQDADDHPQGPNCSCSKAAAVVPPLLPSSSSCQHDHVVPHDQQVKDKPEEEKLLIQPRGKDLLPSSAEEIKAQIRKEAASAAASAATRHQQQQQPYQQQRQEPEMANKADDNNENKSGAVQPLYSAAEDVKDQIRREARWPAAAAGGGGVVDYSGATTTSSIDQNLNDVVTDTRSADAAAGIVDDDNNNNNNPTQGDTVDDSYPTSRTKRVVPRPMAEKVDDGGRGGENRAPDVVVTEQQQVQPLPQRTTTTENNGHLSSTKNYVVHDDDEKNEKVVQVPVDDMEEVMNNNNGSHRGKMLPVPNRQQELRDGELPIVPPAIPSAAAEESIIMSSSSSSSSPLSTTTGASNDQGNNNTSTTTTHTDRDDRTMLDIFGERAKEFLTRRVIPDTDADCRWDWRSVRCEPSCRCHFRPRRGDYHLGRSCRRLLRSHNDAATAAVDDDDDECIPLRPWNDHAAARRFLSLTQQTAGLVKAQAVRVVTEILVQAKTRYEIVQDRVCPAMPCRHKTLPEMILCHRRCRANDEDDDNEEDAIPFAERRSILMKKLQNRFSFKPQQPTDDGAWEF